MAQWSRWRYGYRNGTLHNATPSPPFRRRPPGERNYGFLYSGGRCCNITTDLREMVRKLGVKQSEEARRKVLREAFISVFSLDKKNRRVMKKQLRKITHVSVYWYYCGIPCCWLPTNDASCSPPASHLLSLVRSFLWNRKADNSAIKYSLIAFIHWSHCAIFTTQTKVISTFFTYS